MFRTLAIMAGFLAVAATARADVSADVSALFDARTVVDRDAAIDGLENADPKNPLVPYVLGTAAFTQALEGLGQALHRHGLESPHSIALPPMRLPVPINADPEPLNYEGFRTILLNFRDGLEAAAAQLGMVPEDVEIGVVVDLAKLSIDLNGDGMLAADESVAAVMAALSGANPHSAAGPPDLTFRFDRADGFWLQGYANFLIAQVDFWLAHDFQTAFDSSFHMLFPRAGLPMQGVLVPPVDATGLLSEWRIADVVSFVHLVNWPVIEPERRQTARLKLLEMIRLSRLNWQAIRAETDNDREWLPGPQQPGISKLTGLEVGEEQVVAWHDALQIAEDLLEGRVLLSHWRIAGKGINVKAFFEAPQTFDLVLALTGPGVVPYLENGTLITSETFGRVLQQFGGPAFLGYALWFN
ncbi:hypothetical protein GA830_17835 [Mesorhizobium sp. NBSH29]|nr:hypothetical protein GA830_17835 [Mesorhizobium sp. NBSH29]